MIKSYRRVLIFFHDIAWIPASIFGALFLRLNLESITPLLQSIFILTAMAILVHGFTFYAFGCYRGIWRFASIPDLIRLLKSVTSGAILTIAISFVAWRLGYVPRSVLVLYPIFLFGGVTTSRLLYRIFRDRTSLLDADKFSRTIIVGAGKAGEMLVRDLEHSRQFVVTAFVDDDPEKLGHDVRGIRVRGTTNDLTDLIDEFDAQVILVTMPSAPLETMNKIVLLCAERGVQCRTLPSLTELADGRIEVSRLRPVIVEDLLGRLPINLDDTTISGYLKGRRILVTGGGGSIGSELCRQISQHNPDLLVVLDSCEYNLYRIDQALSTHGRSLVFTSMLGDVRDERTIESFFARVKPQVVFHAAAYKHVPMVEDNVIEGVRNNVFGTRIVASAALRHGAEKFVLISTDKTVNPTNVMGATKRVAEIYCQALGYSGKTQFVTTRFGNVLASDGSVVPLFERQIAAGGPVTITHPDMTRYFMTIPEAASLILQAGVIGKGGEIFVLDMGKPVLIRELAEKMIMLSGLQPGRDIRIVCTGLRPGEKMREELFYEKEELQSTSHPKLLLASSIPAELAAVCKGLEMLEKAVEKSDVDGVRVLLKSLVPEFNPTPLLEQEMHKSTSLRLVKS